MEANTFSLYLTSPSVLGPILILSLFVIYRVFFASSRSTRRRAVSFNSISMAQGAFPPDKNVSPPIINAVLLFKTIPSLEAVKEVSIRLMEYDRFRKVVRHDPKKGTWTFEESAYNNERLFSTISVSSEVELMEEVSRISKMDLSGNGEIPSWHIRRIVNKGRGLSAVVFRIHHVIGDGMAIV